MNTQHFDDIIRSLTASASRRGLLTGLTSGLLAALPFALGGEDAASKKKKAKRKKHKKKNRKKNKKQCLPDGGFCLAPAQCCNGECSVVQTCGPCGGLGEFCCADPEGRGAVEPTIGPTCDGGLECALSGKCVAACGGLGEICCYREPAALCDAPFVCDARVACAAACGGLGEVCCLDPNLGSSRCDGALECAFDGVCVTSCGGVGEPCCPGGVCDGALTCNAGTCE